MSHNTANVKMVTMVMDQHIVRVSSNILYKDNTVFKCFFLGSQISQYLLSWWNFFLAVFNFHDPVVLTKIKFLCIGHYIKIICYLNCLTNYSKWEMIFLNKLSKSFLYAISSILKLYTLYMFINWKLCKCTWCNFKIYYYNTFTKIKTQTSLINRLRKMVIE